MDSPYIVGYLDSFIDGQKINIVLEYCPMGDLNSLVEKQKIAGKPFVDNLLWKIFIHLCLGIEYLHSKDIIHRDLKTLNVFMVKESVAKIGDLGCALAVEQAPEKETPTKDIDLAVLKHM
jgi:NIMA (never in mitosis gene a)-related kinase